MTTAPFVVKNGTILIAGVCINLPHPVGEVVESQGAIIVRVDPPTGEIFNRNIFAFTKHGDFLWQIEESPHGTEKDKPYVGIMFGKDQELVAANWIGIDYFVNITSGSITVKTFDK